MDNHVFLEDNERIHNFIQLTYINLSSTGAVPLRRLEDAYLAMEPIIHRKAAEWSLDCGALYYAAMRLPLCVTKVQRVVLGQSESILEESGVPVSAWSEVFARSRRRRYLFDGHDTLICFIASKSDVDDIIPLLLAFQIEWNKAHKMLSRASLPESMPDNYSSQIELVSSLFGLETDDGKQFVVAFQENLLDTLAEIKNRSMDLYVRNVEASYTRYRRETETWWRQIQTACPGIEDRPVYFVSSNTHSLINLLSGYAESNRSDILAYAASDPSLSSLVEYAPQAANSSLLYYLLMKYEQDDPSGARRAKRIAHEERSGISRIAVEKTLDIPAQVVDLKHLSASVGEYDQRLSALANSNAMVLNIDYPLGRTAYFLLTTLAEHIATIRGVYVIGKAASLFGDRGDIIIPSSIIDQHTRNLYFFENCLAVTDVEPYLDAGVHAIYDNQKAVTVLGTFLQNQEMLSAFLSAGITDLEMEAGPYLAAMYEIAKPKRYPEQETVSLRVPGVDLGIIHYVSDNPLVGRHLDQPLELDGVDATYAATRAVLDRILSRELLEEAK